MKALELVSPYLPKPVIEAVLGYLAKNDLAHQANHVLAVVEHADVIIKAFPGELEGLRKPIITAAFMHDSFCWKDRDEHHLLAYDYLLDLLPDIGFSQSDTEAAALACMEHRASWKGPRDSLCSQAVAAADRGPIDFKGDLKRAMRYRVTRDNLDWGNMTFGELSELISNSADHLVDKFGPEGYAWKTIPTYTSRLYDRQIDTMKRILKSWKQNNDREVLEIGTLIYIEERAKVKVK